MKLLVHLRTQPETPHSPAPPRTLELSVDPQATVKSLKERLAVLEPTPLAQQELTLNGRILEDKLQLIACDIQDGTAVDLILKASEETLANQLLELLQAKTLSLEELGLLYTHKFGISASRALEALGLDENLREFLKRQSCFVVEDWQVSTAAGVKGLTEEEAPARAQRVGDAERLLLEVSVRVEVPAGEGGVTSLSDLSVCVQDRRTETVESLKARISASELIPFPKGRLLLDGSELQDRQRLADCGLKGSSSLDFVVSASEEDFVQQLCELLQARTLPISELQLLYSCRHGTTVTRALKLLGCTDALPGLLHRRAEFTVQSNCVSVTNQAVIEADQRNQRFVDLHEKVCSSSHRHKAIVILQQVAEAVHRTACLNVRSSTVGGSVGRDTAVPGADDAEVVLFVEGLPPANRDQWLPGLIRVVATTLQAQLGSTDSVKSVSAAKDAVQVRCEGDLFVRLSLSPVFDSHWEVIDAFGAHPYSAVALAEHHSRFIADQPPSVKMAIRLLKWWRGQHSWSGVCTRPSDNLLELLVAHAALGLRVPEVGALLEGVRAVLVDFEHAHIVWPHGVGWYALNDVPEALLRQQPLLMDPVNPLTNVADPQAFNSAEMVAIARSADFL